MNRLLVFCLSIVVLAAACGEKKAVYDDVPTFEIDPNASGTIFMSDFVDSVSYIRLENRSDALIWEIVNVYLTDDRVVVVDRKNEKVMVYDKAGNYISKVHRKGRGPGEYLNMSRAFIDDQNRVIILDYWENKLYY